MATENPPSERSAPQRIVAIAPNSAEIICALGACDRIVGASKFCVYPPQLADRPRVGGLFDPDLERIIALRPDLLVLRGRNDSLERLAERLTITAYRDETDTLPGIEVCIRDLGRLLDRTTEADKLIRDFQAGLGGIRARVAGRARPRVFLTVSRQPDRLANILTTGRGTFLDQMVEIAGGVNVFGQLDMIYPEVSTEAILAAQPEVILELMPEARLDPALESRMREQWRRLGPMPAVADNRIHFLTDDNCLIPSPRYVETIRKVSLLLHPSAEHP